MQNRKKTMFLIATVIAVLIATTLASHAIQQNNPVTSKVKEVKIPCTDREKKNSKLLRQSQGEKLQTLAARGTGDITISVAEPLIISTSGETQRATTLQTAVCNAEAIVVGVLNDSSPQLTEDESFIFTEYTMTVEEIIKNNLSSPIQIGGSVNIIRNGGVGQLNGRKIKAKVEGFEPFAVGKRYVLFLRFIQDSNSYLAYANGSFELNGDKVNPLGGMPLNDLRDVTAFLNATRTATATSGCKGQQPNLR